MSGDYEQAKLRAWQSEGAYVTMRPLASSWEQRKLGDVATIVGGGTPSTNNDAYWDGDIDWYSPAELGEQVYADRSVRRITQAGYDSCSATLLPAGKTILFTSRAGIGNTAILRRSACTNQGFQSLVVNDDTDVYFVYSMTDRIKKFAEQKASGSTFLEISGKGLAAGEFAFPSKDEQTAIGSMFKQLDHLITLHQCKCQHCSLCGYLSWEQRKLGELGSVAMCKRIFKEQTTEQGDVPFYKIGTFGGTPDAFISKELFDEYQRLYQFPKVGDILISAAGTIGRTIVYQGDPAYYQDSNIVWLQHDERLDNGFLLQFLNGKSWSSLEGSTLKRLYNKDLLNAEIATPSPDEQHQIGSAFAKLDDIITLHQREPGFTDMGYMRVERALMTMSMSLFSSS